MLSEDEEPYVYSPEVAAKAVAFQQKLLKGPKGGGACNSEIMVQNTNHVARESGLH